MPQVKSGNSNTKIVVLSASAIEARGYSAQIHPEGYVYFTKNNEASAGENSEQSSSTDLFSSQQTDGNADQPHENVYWQQGETEGGENVQYDQNNSEYAPDEHTYYVNIKNEHIVNEENSSSYQYAEENATSNQEIGSMESNSEMIVGNMHGEEIRNQDEQNTNVFRIFSQNAAKEPISIQTELDDNNRYTRQKITYTFATGSAKRKLHKSYINGWSKDIEKHGFARCLIASCNFLSLNMYDMQEHYKTCDGVPSYLNNLCNICNGRLPNVQQLNVHMKKCEGQGRQVTVKSGASNNREPDVVASIRLQEWGKQILENGTAACGISQCNFQASNIIDLQSHQILCDGMAHYDAHTCMLCRRWFASKDDLTKHQPYCPSNRKKSDANKNKKQNFIHFKDIQKISSNKNMNMDCIVQPSPPIPDGIYLRRRGYTKQHKASWEAALKKNNYVRCMFKNCYFLGMSLEDMISHFGYCRGDTSFGEFTCQFCKGRVTSEEILRIHIERSHLAEYEAELAAERNKEMEEARLRVQKSSVVELKREKEEEIPDETQDYFYDSLYGEPECSLTVKKTVPEPERVQVSVLKSPDRKINKVVRTYQRKGKVNKMIEKALKGIGVEVPSRPATIEEEREEEENFNVGLAENNYDRGNQIQEVTFSSFEEAERQNEVEMPIQEMNSLLITNSEDRREIDPLCIDADRPEDEERQEDAVMDTSPVFLKPEIHHHDEDHNAELHHREDEMVPEEEQSILPEISDEQSLTHDQTCSENASEQFTNENQNFYSILRHELQREPFETEPQPEPAPEMESQPEPEPEFTQEPQHEPEPVFEPTPVLEYEPAPASEYQQASLPEYEPPPVPEYEPLPEFKPIPLPKTRRSGRQKNSETTEPQPRIQIKNTFSLTNHDEPPPPPPAPEPVPTPPTAKKRGRKRKVAEDPPADVLMEPEVIIKPRGRRRGRVITDEYEDMPLACLKTEEPVAQPKEFEKGGLKCAKCDYSTSSTDRFENHNIKNHLGLSWIEGGEPFDMENVPLLESTMKKVFRILKSVKCEICGVVKKSALGYVSHIQSCGKSREEKEALKVECLECGAKVLRYSLAAHMKLTHPDPVPGLEGQERSGEAEEPLPEHLAGKRRSAVKAARKFEQVLKESEEDAAPALSYVFYQKNSSKIPKLPRKIQNLWSKMKREGRKIPCRRAQCFFESENVQEARKHHFLCPELPDEVYVCECCDYFTDSEMEMKIHSQNHLEPVEKEFAYTVDEFQEAEAAQEMDIDGFVDEGDEMGIIAAKKNLFKPRTQEEMSLEAERKRDFMIREKLINPKNNQLYHQTLDMTLEAEASDLEDLPTWPEFRTKETDWIAVEDNEVSEYLPPLSESVSVHLCREQAGDVNWKVFKRFESDNLADSPVLFTGGTVSSMSWCRIFANRLKEKSEKQYLAVATCQEMDKERNIRERAASPGLIQIWDCGILENSRAMDLPKMVLGIAHDYGEISDLSWVPADLYLPGTKEHLPRLGLLTAACQDGNVRIWSVCDPTCVTTKHKLPIYKIQPSVILKPSDPSDVCLKFAISRKGLAAGGYSNGIVFLWNLECINSPFTKKEGETYIIRSFSFFEAHRCPITALAMSLVDGHYIGTSSYDRTVKFWDVRFPKIPTEIFNKETGMDIVFPRNWPVTFFCFEDVVAGASKAVYKAIKDLIFEGHRTALCLESLLWSLSFSDWLNSLCCSSLIGEIKIRFFRNIFMADQKHAYRSEAVLSSVELRKLNASAEEKDVGNDKTKSKDGTSNFPRTYTEAKSSYGLVITDYSVDLNAKKDKVVKHKLVVDEYPIKSATKVCFNPNFESFTHLAIGYHCGLVRIVTLEKIQRDLNLIKFINRHKAS